MRWRGDLGIWDLRCVAAGVSFWKSEAGFFFRRKKTVLATVIVFAYFYNTKKIKEGW